MPEVHIKSLKQFQELTASDVAVVKFTAAWCGPCRRMAPEFEKLANIEFEPKANFMSIDIDKAEENKELAGLIANVSGIPTFHFYKDGKLVDEMSGANMPELLNKLDKLTAKAGMVCKDEPKKEEDTPEAAEEEAKPAEEAAEEEKPAEEAVEEEKLAEATEEPKEKSDSVNLIDL